MFLPVRFEWIPVDGVLGYGVELLSIIGIGVILGIMGFGFFGMRPAIVIAVVGMLAVLPFGFNFLRDYTVLTGSLVAYAVSFLVCYFMSFRSKEDFDYSIIKKITGDFDTETDESAQVGAAAMGKLESTSAQKFGE